MCFLGVTPFFSLLAPEKQQVYDISHYSLEEAFFVVQLLSCVWLFETPWTAACEASLSFTISRSLLKLVSIKSVKPSNHLILWHPLSSCLQFCPASGSFTKSWPFPSGGQSIGASESVLPMNIQDWLPLGINWFDLLAVQGTLRSLLQNHSSKASILQHSTFFIVHFSHLYKITGNTIALSIGKFRGKIMSLLFNTLSRFVIAFVPPFERF